MLAGLLLTGLRLGDGRLNEPLLELLQNYVDRTGDVQTAAAIVVVTRDPLVIETERARRWIELYRQLLNWWQLWTERRVLAHILKCNCCPFLRGAGLRRTEAPVWLKRGSLSFLKPSWIHRLERRVRFRLIRRYLLANVHPLAGLCSTAP